MSRAIAWILLGTGSCGAVLIGLWWHRPARSGPWLLLAGSVASMAVGDILFEYGLDAAAEPFYLGMFVLVAAALLQFTRGGSALADRARLIDVLACVCAALLVVWVFVLDGSGVKVSAADVIGDLLLLGVAIRLTMATGANVAAILLLTGSAGLLAADVAWGMYPGHLAEIGYLVLYVAWGLAALHPSMTRLTHPTASRPAPWRGRWAFLLGAAVATPPAVLLVEALRGDVEDGVVIAVAGAITLLLTITRLADSISLSNQALTRERALRTASAALVSAADQPEVDEAVHNAVARLVHPQTVTRVRLAADHRQLSLEALPPDPAGPHPRSWWVDDQAPSAARGSAAHVAGAATLVCPLWLEPLAVARPSGGALILTGRRDVLTAARDALEVLAGQAALALDRISLVEAVGRRDSDLYLRAVIHNTADLMLVIDEDHRVRYASPALHDLLGTTGLSPLATLEDLVHDDDRTEVSRAFTTDGDGTVFCALRRSDESQILVEATYRDLRDDRLVQGYVVTMRNVTSGHDPVERLPRLLPTDALPAWVNRRSAQHKFRY